MTPACTRAPTNMAATTLRLVGDAADLPDPILRWSPVTGRNAESLDVEDLSLGYDAETLSYQQPRSKMRSTSRTGPWGG
jgi:hypothetical protein